MQNYYESIEFYSELSILFPTYLPARVKLVVLIDMDGVGCNGCKGGHGAGRCVMATAYGFPTDFAGRGGRGTVDTATIGREVTEVFSREKFVDRGYDGVGADVPCCIVDCVRKIVGMLLIKSDVRCTFCCDCGNNCRNVDRLEADLEACRRCS